MEGDEYLADGRVVELDIPAARERLENLDLSDFGPGPGTRRPGPSARDGGKTFTTRTPPDPLVDLAVDPDDARRWVATTATGSYTSGDEGGTWRQVDPVPNSNLVLPAGPDLYRRTRAALHDPARRHGQAVRRRRQYVGHAAVGLRLG